VRAATTPATMPAIDLVLKGADEGGVASRVPNGVSDPVAGDVLDGVLGDVPDGVFGDVFDGGLGDVSDGALGAVTVVVSGGGGVLEGSLTVAANFIPSSQCSVNCAEK
jgi:hypothetical protein